MISIIIISIITTSITIAMIANILVIISTIISTSASLIHAVTGSEYCHNYSTTVAVHYDGYDSSC